MPIDTVAFDFIASDHLSIESIKQAPVDGCYIRGLSLEGARWDYQNHVLAESRPKELYTDLPIMWLRPVQFRVPPKDGFYNCPVYKTLLRAGIYPILIIQTFIIWDHEHSYFQLKFPNYILFNELNINAHRIGSGSGYAGFYYGLGFPIWWWKMEVLELEIRLDIHMVCLISRILNFADDAGTLSTTGHSTNFVMYMELPSDQLQSKWINRGVGLFTGLAFWRPIRPPVLECEFLYVRIKNISS